MLKLYRDCDAALLSNSYRLIQIRNYHDKSLNIYKYNVVNLFKVLFHVILQSFMEFEDVKFFRV